AFSMAGDVAVKSVALVDGEKWRDMDYGLWDLGQGSFFPYVNALTVFDGRLYAGGKFDREGVAGNLLSGFAWWADSRWANSAWIDQNFLHCYGPTGSPTFRALCAWNNKLVAGGQFWQVRAGNG